MKSRLFWLQVRLFFDRKASDTLAYGAPGSVLFVSGGYNGWTWEPFTVRMKKSVELGGLPGTEW